MRGEMSSRPPLAFGGVPLGKPREQAHPLQKARVKKGQQRDFEREILGAYTPSSPQRRSDIRKGQLRRPWALSIEGLRPPSKSQWSTNTP